MILEKSETIRDTKTVFTCATFLPSRVAKQVISPRAMKVWMWLRLCEIESLASQDLFETCTSVDPVPESDKCQIGMTEIVMGDVNAFFTLECAHRRQLLAARLE